MSIEVMFIPKEHRLTFTILLSQIKPLYFGVHHLQYALANPNGVRNFSLRGNAQFQQESNRLTEKEEETSAKPYEDIINERFKVSFRQRLHLWMKEFESMFMGIEQRVRLLICCHRMEWIDNE